jgi:excisionase family DNA binding protein
MSDDRVMTTEEVMEYLHLNRRTIYRLVLRRGLPGFRTGRQWRFHKRDLDAWLKRNKFETSEPPPPSRILVAEDDPGIRKLLVDTLVRNGYVVDTADDGLSAVQLVQRGDYDLLMTDLKMPGVDGLSLIREARRKNPDIPVIVLTGFSTHATAIEALHLRVYDYLTKPFRLAHAMQLTASALGNPPMPNLPAADFMVGNQRQ